MRLTLLKKQEEIPNVISFYFNPDTKLNWRPGQFLRYHIENKNPDERSTNRFFTIASAPFEKEIQLTTRFDKENGSSFKKDLASLNIGGTVVSEGPMGSFVIGDPSKTYVFLAGGIGITPFRSMLLDLDHNNLPINITLLYANRDENIVFKDEFDKLTLKHPGFKVHYVIDPQKIDEALIRSTVPDLLSPIYYVSGPAPMVKGIESTLEGIGVSEDNIKHDYFPGYDRI